MTSMPTEDAADTNNELPGCSLVYPQTSADVISPIYPSILLPQDPRFNLLQQQENDVRNAVEKLNEIARQNMECGNYNPHALLAAQGLVPYALYPNYLAQSLAYARSNNIPDITKHYLLNCVSEPIYRPLYLDRAVVMPQDPNRMVARKRLNNIRTHPGNRVMSHSARVDFLNPNRYPYGNSYPGVFYPHENTLNGVLTPANPSPDGHYPISVTNRPTYPAIEPVPLTTVDTSCQTVHEEPPVVEVPSSAVVDSYTIADAATNTDITSSDFTERLPLNFQDGRQLDTSSKLYSSIIKDNTSTVCKVDRGTEMPPTMAEDGRHMDTTLNNSSNVLKDHTSTVSKVDRGTEMPPFPVEYGHHMDTTPKLHSSTPKDHISTVSKVDRGTEMSPIPVEDGRHMDTFSKLYSSMIKDRTGTVSKLSHGTEMPPKPVENDVNIPISERNGELSESKSKKKKHKSSKHLSESENKKTHKRKKNEELNETKSKKRKRVRDRNLLIEEQENIEIGDSVDSNEEPTTLPPSKSFKFLESILCRDVGKKFLPTGDNRKDFRCSRMAEDNAATELPFSILSIREQRKYLMESGDSFVQDTPCHDLTKTYGVETSGPTMGQNSWVKCRECRSIKQNESQAVFCRFYGFRKLRFRQKILCTTGFLLPEECSERDLQLWLPQKLCFWEKRNNKNDILSPNDPLDRSMCDFLLSNIALRFCDIVSREKKAISWVEKAEVIFWKKPVTGVREMCDVCETTLFNMHWICRRCGYGVCLDCYERRMKKTIAEQELYDNEKSNHFRWGRCIKGKNHFHSLMLPTQIIPSSCLFDLNEMVHKICASRNIELKCSCQYKSTEISKFITKVKKQTVEKPLNNGIRSRNPSDSNSNRNSSSSVNVSSLPIMVNGTTVNVNSQSLQMKEASVCLVDMLCKASWEKSSPEKMKKETEPVSKSCDAEEDINNWLCEGRLLQLTDSHHPKNIEIFKQHWKLGVPVLVSGVGKHLNMSLWHPSQLSREYGDENSRNSLVNCITGSIVTNMKIRDFWDGFENISQRLLDENKKTMILKLKDWPPTLSFHEVMPEVFEDLMRALPLPDYTFINGKCNLASRLPHFFVKPDLGPKMYNAYGWVTEKNWKQGTTNLHLDISDAVNIMVYVGIPVDEPPEARETLLKIVKEGEVDDIQSKRALVDKPGALWHIFHEKDVDKIRKFINKVCLERGETVAADHDPIHDQQMYLDKELRHRLKEEYDVEGYSILQCQGDGVFIPAGAPHQVFNLHSCIKIAEDFVSPEHIDECFTLTNEFRYLSSTHSNHEDKLQIKNIIYHSVKDIVSSALHQHCV